MIRKHSEVNKKRLQAIKNGFLGSHNTFQKIKKRFLTNQKIFQQYKKYIEGILSRISPIR